MLLADSPYFLPHLPHGSGEEGVGLSLYPLEVAAAAAATDGHLHRWLSCGWR
jgi:hypothetical protein